MKIIQFKALPFTPLTGDGTMLVFAPTPSQMDAVVKYMTEHPGVYLSSTGSVLDMDELKHKVKEMRRLYYTIDLVWGLNHVQKKALKLIWRFGDTPAGRRAVSAYLSEELDESLTQIKKYVDDIKLPDLGYVEREGYMRLQGLGPAYPPVSPEYFPDIKAHVLSGKAIPHVPFPEPEYWTPKGYVQGSVERWLHEKRLQVNLYYEMLFDGTTFVQQAQKFTGAVELPRLLTHPTHPSRRFFVDEDDERYDRVEDEYGYRELSYLPMAAMGRVFDVPSLWVPSKDDELPTRRYTPEELWELQYT